MVFSRGFSPGAYISMIRVGRSSERHWSTTSSRRRQAESAATDALVVRTFQQFNYIVGPSGQLVWRWHRWQLISLMRGNRK
jgi:hypothetical protein